MFFISLVAQIGKAIINNIYHQYWTQLNRLNIFTTGYKSINFVHILWTSLFRDFSLLFRDITLLNHLVTFPCFLQLRRSWGIPCNGVWGWLRPRRLCWLTVPRWPWGRWHGRHQRTFCHLVVLVLPFTVVVGKDHDSSKDQTHKEWWNIYAVHINIKHSKLTDGFWAGTSHCTVNLGSELDNNKW